MTTFPYGLEDPALLAAASLRVPKPDEDLRARLDAEADAAAELAADVEAEEMEPDATPPDDLEQAWLAERNKLVGASEASAVLGVHPYVTGLEVWGHKRGRISTTPAEREEMIWGRILEDPIAREWSRRTGREIVDHGRFTLLRHPTAPHLGCTLDREIVGPPPEPLEIKTCDDWMPEWREGRAPLYQVVQVQMQLAVTGWQRGVLACLVGRRLRAVPIERDDRLIARALEAIEDFWEQYVETDIEPPVEFHARALEAVKALHPKDSGKTIELSLDHADLVKRWEQAKADEKAAEKDKEALQGQIIQALGDATWARLPGDGGRLQCRVEPRKAYFVKGSEPRVLRHLKR